VTTAWYLNATKFLGSCNKIPGCKKWLGSIEICVCFKLLWGRTIFEQFIAVKKNLFLFSSPLNEQIFWARRKKKLNFWQSQKYLVLKFSLWMVGILWSRVSGSKDHVRFCPVAWSFLPHHKNQYLCNKCLLGDLKLFDSSLTNFSLLGWGL